MKSRIGLVQKTAELFQIKSKLPVKDGSPQYRIRSDEETYERVTTEDNLEVADNPSA
ncbi:MULTISPECIES: hypothetical protein [unclassified Mesorhizobium]|nr:MULTISPECIES: hypothetical protein [unclassified Mesorhizobium]